VPAGARDSPQEDHHLLAQVDRATSDSERDYLLFALLYDPGARIQEVHSARYLLVKYLGRAGASMAPLNRPGVSPHTLWHTRAMLLLQANVPLVTIKDVLGHADVKSTEIYVLIDRR